MGLGAGAHACWLRVHGPVRAICHVSHCHVPRVMPQDSVDMVDFEAAIDRVIGGLEKKNKVGMSGGVTTVQDGA